MKPTIIVSNGYADGPSQALRDYIIQKGQDVTMIIHPLVPETNLGHIVEFYKNGKKICEKNKRLFHKPPYTYIFDLLFPLVPEKCGNWVAFNNLSALRGICLKKLGRVDKVVYWAVDFVPERFGTGVATRIYDTVDRFVCKRVDLRVDLSRAALLGRNKYHGLKQKEIAPCIVVPMGAWLNRTPKTSLKLWKKHKVVYLGHLVERQGVRTLIEAISLLKTKSRIKVKLEIIGAGPMLEELKEDVRTLGIKDMITFHGFVKDHRSVEKILAACSVAVAPYKNDPESFTQFADPGKLKAYLGAYLPIVLTDVPPNAHELQAAGAAKIVEDSPQALADGIVDLLENEDAWKKSFIASQGLAETFNWPTLLDSFFRKLG